MQGEQVPKVSTATCTFEPFFTLCSIIAGSRPALGSGVQGAAVEEDPCRGLCCPTLGQAQQGSQVVDQRLEDTGHQPALRLLVDGLSGWEEVVG